MTSNKRLSILQSRMSFLPEELRDIEHQGKQMFIQDANPQSSEELQAQYLLNPNVKEFIETFTYPDVEQNDFQDLVEPLREFLSSSGIMFEQNSIINHTSHTSNTQIEMTNVEGTSSLLQEVLANDQEGEIPPDQGNDQTTSNEEEINNPVSVNAENQVQSE